MEDMLEAEFENLMNTQVNVLILVFREDMLGGSGLCRSPFLQGS